jgi:hypothetical protein
MDDYGSLGLLMLPRGHGKSTILEVYNAYRIYKDPDHMILHQGATDSDAYKISRGTAAVLEKHPLTRHTCVRVRGETQRWWVQGCTDVKHGNIHARGILSNVTGSRALEIQCDDVEVPNTTNSQELRDKLSYRLSEQVHILIPNGQRLFVGTPHSHDSLYNRIRESGANCLILKMFSNEKRIMNVETGQKVTCSYKPDIIFSGVSSHSKTLEEGLDYTIIVTNSVYEVIFKHKQPLVDIYGVSLWPDRFTSDVMLQRRKECSTLGEWDSQYQLHATPITELRLDPDKLIPYTDEPVITKANRETVMMLGSTQIVSAALQFDPSSGKVKSDVSAVALVLQDSGGNLYWHRAIALTGDICTSDDKGKTIGVIEEFKLPRVTIETNGIGGHIPAILKATLKQRGVLCGVTEIHVTTNKNKRILAAISPALESGLLYIHSSIGEDVKRQMRNFNPATTSNKDDYIDSLAGAIGSLSTRIKSSSPYPTYDKNKDWRGRNGAHTVTLDF